MATLTLDHVTKIYGGKRSTEAPAVKALDMAIGDGEIVGLLGSSGCGKTSTLRMIAGFEEVTEGAIRLGERVLNDLAPSARNVAMAFEGYALYPPLRIRDNIGFALLRDRHPKAEVQAKVRQIAELLDIEAILERYPPTLSAGQQQRTSLARALIRQADAFLLDEPMSQLEPQLRAILRARIKDWLIERRMTTVFVTHDQTEAIALADRIAVMEQGVLQQFASPQDLKEQPANLFVASFIGEPPMNVFEAEIIRAGERLTLIAKDDDAREAFRIALPAWDLAPGKVYLGVRPHRISFGNGPGSLLGQVLSHHWLGDQTHLGVKVGEVTLIAVAEGAITAPVGSEISIGLPPGSVHIFDAASEQALFHGSSSTPMEAT